MQITDQDKIILLERLGYFPVFVAEELWTIPGTIHKHKSQITIKEFNPLNLSVLLKLIQVVEKDGIAWLITSKPREEEKYVFILMSSNTKVFKGASNDKPEYAILEGLLKYFKSE